MSELFSFGEWVRRRRKALDFTQEALAQLVGCAPITIRRIEADERRPSRQMAERLAQCLKLPAEDHPAFLRAARAELVVDQLASPLPALPALPQPSGAAAVGSAQALRGYQLHEPLGSGGFGIVYRAEHPTLSRAVALKVILPEHANQAAFIRRFEAEAQLVARLEHPHIVPLYDYWRDPSGAYLVMRYMRGGSLRDAMAGGPWPLERCLRILEQLASALSFAHHRGVVHRDVKPANIMLDEEGRAYLADFGIAKDLFAGQDDTLSPPGALLDTPAYLSPEQLRAEPITPRTDLYRLALVLYELLTGAHPFGTASLAERLRMQLELPQQALHDSWSALPEGLRVVFRRALAPWPDERYPDALALFNAFRQAVTTLPIPGSRTGSDELSLAAPSSRDGSAAYESETQALVPSQAEELRAFSVGSIENPYKGLRAFAEADAADFFGREALTRRLLERLAEEHAGTRFLAVVGPSGSGKSSVVRAGLVPAVRRGSLPGSQHWFVSELLPGPRPLEELEAALLRVAVNPPSSLLEQLQKDARGLARAVKRVLPADAESELLLVIDQFEELWTLVEDEAQRQLVLDSLVAAVNDPRSRLRVVVTLRADFFDRPLLHQGLGALMRARAEVVLPLSTEELQQAIVGPAARVGLKLERGLVTTMVADVAAQAGALPLLQYALTELYELRAGRLLTLAAYRQSGGVAGALARRADALYEALDAAGQAATRQLFLRLISLGEGAEDTRRRARWSELASLVGDAEPREAAVEAYGRYRLLTFDRDPSTRERTIELAHEALLREWGRLRAWLVESREELRLQQRLASAAAEWAAERQDASFLATGTRLEQFAVWAEEASLQLNAQEMAFLEASLARHEQERVAAEAAQQQALKQAQALAEEQRRRAEMEQQRAEEQADAAQRLRRRAFYLAGAFIAALLLAGTALVLGQVARSNAYRAEQEAANARSRELAASALSNLAIDPERSILLALEAVALNPTLEAENALHRALAAMRVQRTLARHTGEVYDLALSPDGTALATAGQDGTALIWDRATGQLLQTLTGHQKAVRSIAYSPDGTRLATAGEDGKLIVWDAQSGQQLNILAGNSAALWSVSFHPDGMQLATGGADFEARVWNLKTGISILRFVGHEAEVTDVVFSPNGRQLATGSWDGTARVWDTASGAQLHTLTVGSQIDGVDFSLDGMRLATADEMGLAHIWDVSTGQKVLTLSGHLNVLFDVKFSPDGSRIATAGLDRRVKIWDSASGKELITLAGHSRVINRVAFSSDGTLIATASGDGTARLWELGPSRELITFPSVRSGGDVSFSPDGNLMARGMLDGTTWVWDIASETRLFHLTGQRNLVSDVAFSPDGRRLAAASYDGSLNIWDMESGRTIHQITAHTKAAIAVTFSPDGRYVATGSGDQTAVLWDAATGARVRTLVGHTSRVFDIAFSPDGTRIATSSEDGTVIVWDASTGEHMLTFPNHHDTVYSVTFSADGTRIVSAGRDGTARIWDGVTGQELLALSGHAGTITSVALSPDGRLIATASKDETVKIWDAATGQERLTLEREDILLTTVAFSPDGKTLVAGSEYAVRIYVLGIDDLVSLARLRVTRHLTIDECQKYLHRDTCPPAK